MSAPKRNADWRWERAGCRVYSSEFHRGRPLKVAEVAFGELDEAGLEARGRLIAAAPDLLEAALAVEALVGRFIRYDADREPVIADAFQSLRKAICKTSGEAAS